LRADQREARQSMVFFIPSVAGHCERSDLCDEAFAKSRAISILIDLFCRSRWELPRRDAPRNDKSQPSSLPLTTPPAYFYIRIQILPSQFYFSCKKPINLLSQRAHDQPWSVVLNSRPWGFNVKKTFGLQCGSQHGNKIGRASCRERV